MAILYEFSFIYENIDIKLCIFLGLQIIFTLDEVSFIQNLVFYIEEAYRTPVRLSFTRILKCIFLLRRTCEQF